MVSLTDIGAITRNVNVRGIEIPIKPISVHDLIRLLDRYPPLREILAQRRVSISAESLLKLAPEIVAAIVVVGMGKAGDKIEETAALDLGVGELAEILSTLIDITFPRGTRPFVEMAEKLGLADGSEGTGKGPPTKSPVRSNTASSTGMVNGSGPTVPDNSQPSLNLSTETNSETAPT